MQNKLAYILSLSFALIAMGCSSTNYVSVGVSVLSPIMVTEITIDTVQFLQPNLSAYNLGPIGGSESLKALIRYPQIARMAGVTGKVRVKLQINSNGEIDSSIVLSSTAELFNQPSLEGVRKARYFPLLNSEAAGYSMIIGITFSLINIEQISFEHRTTRFMAPFFKVNIKNDGSCTYTGINNVEKIGTYAGTIDTKEYFMAATAVRSQILKIPYDFNDRKNDSTIIVSYTENGNTKTYAGRIDYTDHNYFWVIDAIFSKIIKDVYWLEKERK